MYTYFTLNYFQHTKNIDENFSGKFSPKFQFIRPLTPFPKL